MGYLSINKRDDTHLIYYKLFSQYEDTLTNVYPFAH